MIEITDLRVSYGERQVAHVPELHVGAREVVGIVGESGSGKSQTALAVLGLTRYTGARVTGSITLGGQELTSMSNRDLQRVRGRRVAMIMQSPRAALNPTIRLGALFSRTLALHGVPKGARRERMDAALDEVVLSRDILDRFPHQVSGGQAQRFSIALVSALRSEVIIADEPTSALDVTVQSEVIDLLGRLRDNHGTAIIFISHDLAVVSELAERVVVMRHGSVVESGRTAQVLGAPQTDYTRALLDAVPRIRAEIEP